MAYKTSKCPQSSKFVKRGGLKLKKDCYTNKLQMYWMFDFTFSFSIFIVFLNRNQRMTFRFLFHCFKKWAKIIDVWFLLVYSIHLKIINNWQGMFLKEVETSAGRGWHLGYNLCICARYTLTLNYDGGKVTTFDMGI